MINTRERQALFLSIKPKYVKKILDGEKTVELRKSMPCKVSKGNMILIYSTAPEKELIGFCEIEKIVCASPSELWSQVNKKAGVTKEEFEDYFHQNETACAIQIKNIEKFISPIKLNRIKELIPNFAPPQTYKYLDFDDITSLSMEQIIVP